MTAAVAHIMHEVEHLSPRDLLELHRQIASLIPMGDDLVEDDYAALAAASFHALDEEEAKHA